MIEPLIDGAKDCFEFAEIPNPAGKWVYFASNIDGHTKRMSMEASAFVTGGHIRKPMSRFESELFENFHKKLAKW